MAVSLKFQVRRREIRPRRGKARTEIVTWFATNAGDYTIRITARSSWPTDDMLIRTNGLTAYATTLGDMLILHFTNSMSLAVGDTIDFVGSSYPIHLGHGIQGS